MLNKQSSAPGGLPSQIQSVDTPHDALLWRSRRLCVRVGADEVPLFPDRPVLDSAGSPWTGLVIEKHHHQKCEIPVHEHNTLCLHVQTEGEVDMDWFHSGRSGRVRSTPGSMILLPAGTRDSVVWSGTTERIVVSVEPSLLNDAGEQLGMKGPFDFHLRWAFQDDQLRSLMTEMCREMRSGWTMGALYGDLLGMALSVALLKKFGVSAAPFPNIKGGLSRSHIKMLFSFIQENLDTDIRVAELAQLVGLSRFHFVRAFRQSLGESPYQYILRLRIQHAKRLLLKPEWNVRQVASAIGFSDPSQFSRMFRKLTGLSPGDWRRNS